MNTNEFYHSNPFLKGFISEEDRKKQLKYVSGNYEFYSETVDLMKSATKNMMTKVIYLLIM